MGRAGVVVVVSGGALCTHKKQVLLLRMNVLNQNRRPTIAPTIGCLRKPRLQFERRSRVPWDPPSCVFLCSPLV